MHNGRAGGEVAIMLSKDIKAKPCKNNPNQQKIFFTFSVFLVKEKIDHRSLSDTPLLGSQYSLCLSLQPKIHILYIALRFTFATQIHQVSNSWKACT